MFFVTPYFFALIIDFIENLKLAKGFTNEVNHFQKISHVS